MNARQLCRTAVSLLLMIAGTAAMAAFDPVNDDTDIFLADPSFNAERPNVLIILDNTANWNQPFTAEKTALINVVNSLSDQLNVGIAMFTETGSGNGGNDGAYIRYAIRQMTSANKAAFTGLVNALDSSGDKSNGGKMALAMYEAYLYFAGGTAYAGGTKAKRDYAGNTAGGPTGAVPGSFAGNAFASSSSTTYVSPITSSCQKNFIIYMSNGKAQDSAADLSTAQSALAGVNGGTTPPQITLSNVSPDSSSQQGNWADEWAKWMSLNDCNSQISGVQKVTTYTVDIGPSVTTDPSTQGAGWSTLLKSTAISSGGKYFAINNSDPNEAQAIQNALSTIFSEVQAVNSVFAATTLPVSVNVRGTNLNQVYIGVFRPDPSKLPRWFGNLKMYKLGVDSATQNLFLADANGGVASNSATGFISNSAQSFWTTSSTYWSFRSPSYASTDVGQASDLPDGDLVEKGAAAERLRILFPTSQGARNVYTCTSTSPGYCASGDSLSSTPFSAGGTGNPADNTHITAADLGAFTSYTVNSLAAADNGNGTSTVTATLAAIPSPAFSNGDTVRVLSALPNAFNGDWAIAGYTTDPVAGTATFTYQMPTVLPGNIAAVQTGSAHQMRTGDLVTVSGATPSIYNMTDAPLTVINSTRFTYTLSGNATSAASGATLVGKKLISSISGTGTTATVSIPSHGYSGVSVVGLTITGSAVPAFNVTNATATVISTDTLQVTTSSTITGSATTARVTATAHELQTGDLITVTGSTNGYNATNATVTRIDANTFQYVPTGPISAANVGTLTVAATRNVNLSATDSPSRSLAVGSSKGTAIGNTGSFVHNLSTAWKVTVTGVTSNTNFNVSNLAITLPTSTSFTYSISNSVAANTVASGSPINAAFTKSLTTAVALPVVTDAAAGMYAGTTISATSVAVRSTATGAITAGRPTDQDTTQRATIINWVRGADNKEDENLNSSFSDIRTSVHGDVLHSRPAVVNYNRFGDDNDVYAFYGSNDGMLHALKAGAASSETGINPGDERWSFIPREFFSKLKRLRDNSPSVSSNNPKPYFADGPITIYSKDANGDGKLDPSGSSGDKVYLYAGFHRGGQFLYALDITSPGAPKLLWRKSSSDTGYAELGQTWSSPTVARIGASTGNASNPDNVVLIFGLGYDPNVDDVNSCLLQRVDADTITLKAIGNGTVDYSTPIGGCTINNATGSTTTRSRSMGRGVVVVDAFDGHVVWQVGRAASATVSRSDMSCSMPSDVTVIDFDRNGIVDWVYAVDTCANLWRIDMGGTSTSSWNVNKLASLSGTTATDIPNQRKFLFPADAVSTSDTIGNYIAVLVGSGDRQHAFDTTIQDRFYMIKDRTSASTPSPSTILDADLFDATSANGVNDSGWKMSFGLGEKNVGGTVTLGGTTFFNTNQPSATAGGGACGNNLGIARQYSVNFADAGATSDVNGSGAIGVTDRARVVEGGGFLPSPVPATVEIGGKRYQVVISGTQVQQPPGATLDTRQRTYWYREYE